MSPDSPSSKLGAPETSSKHPGSCYSHQKLWGPWRSDSATKKSPGPRARKRHVVRGAEKFTCPVLYLLVVSSGPAHTRRISRPHPTTSCALTSWRLLAASPSHRPPPTPGPHLYSELQVGLGRSTELRIGAQPLPLPPPKWTFPK